MSFKPIFRYLELPSTFVGNTPVSFFERKETSDERVQLIKVSKINLVIGPNNSGKSQICRIILRDFPTKSLVSINKNKLIKEIVNTYISRLRNLKSLLPGRIYLEGIFDGGSTPLYEILPEIDSARNIIHVISLTKIDELFIYINDKKTLFKDIQTDIRQLFIDTYLDFMNIRDEYTSLVSYEKGTNLYIPTIRFSTHFMLNSNWDDYLYKYYYSADKPASNSDDDELIFTGKNTNSKMRLYRNSPNFDDVDVQSDFQDFLSTEFFGGRRVILVSPEEVGDSRKEETKNKSDKELMVRVEGEEAREIYRLGDGIGQIILIFWRLFRDKKKYGFVVIEEIEQNLHPGLQRHILRLLTKHDRFKNFIFFLPTHSNHLIECYNEFPDLMKVFNVAKRYEDNGNVKPGEFYFEDVSKRLQTAKESLQVNNTSVLLTNSVIFVEGYTDLLYFRKYFETVKDAIKIEIDKLSKTYSFEQVITKLGLDSIVVGLKIKEKHTLQLMPSMRENLHFGFLYGSGKNVYNYTTVSHLPLADYYNMEMETMKPILELVVPKAKIFCDKDGKENDKHPIYKHFTPEDVEILNVREIENTLSMDVLDMCMPLFLYKGQNYEANPNAVLTMNDPILDIIKERVNDDSKLKEIASSATSINCKKELASEAIKHITYENMTDEAKRIALLMFRHILHCNPDLRAGGR